MILYLLSITNDEDKHILIYLYDNYRKRMFKEAFSIVRDQHLAEDVVQDAFERIIKKIHLIKKIKCNALGRYTVLITRSIACNFVKKESKHRTLPFEDMEFALNLNKGVVEDSVVQKEEVQIIIECLNRMGVNYASSMILRYYYGFSDRETAEMLGINSASTVRSLCYRGRKHINDRMAKIGDFNE